MASYQLNKELAQHDNVAVALAMSGYYFATSAVFIGTLFGSSEGAAKDFILVGGLLSFGPCIFNTPLAGSTTKSSSENSVILRNEHEIISRS